MSKHEVTVRSLSIYAWSLRQGSRFQNLRRRHLHGSISPSIRTKDSTMSTIDAELDTSGLNCPLPILKAKKELARLQPGQVLRIIATDPESVRDFAVFSQQLGHSLLESQEIDGRFYFLLRKRD